MLASKKQETINAYNTGAAALAQKFEKLGVRTADIDRAFGYVKNEQPVVFEIGCGNGRDGREILQRTPHYIGIDASESMITLARQAVPKGNFVVADMETYSFPANVDIIFAFASLLHLDKDEVKRILQKGRQSLNEGGIFYISLKYGQYAEYTVDEAFGRRTHYLYMPEDIIELIGQGYRILWQDIHERAGQKWFTLVLRKVAS